MSTGTILSILRRLTVSVEARGNFRLADELHKLRGDDSVLSDAALAREQLARIQSTQGFHTEAFAAAAQSLSQLLAGGPISEDVTIGDRNTCKQLSPRFLAQVLGWQVTTPLRPEYLIGPTEQRVRIKITRTRDPSGEILSLCVTQYLTHLFSNPARLPPSKLIRQIVAGLIHGPFEKPQHITLVYARSDSRGEDRLNFQLGGTQASPRYFVGESNDLSGSLNEWRQLSPIFLNAFGLFESSTFAENFSGQHTPSPLLVPKSSQPGYWLSLEGDTLTITPHADNDFTLPDPRHWVESYNELFGPQAKQPESGRHLTPLLVWKQLRFASLFVLAKDETGALFIKENSLEPRRKRQKTFVGPGNPDEDQALFEKTKEGEGAESASGEAPHHHTPVPRAQVKRSLFFPTPFRKPWRPSPQMKSVFTRFGTSFHRPLQTSFALKMHTPLLARGAGFMRMG